MVAQWTATEATRLMRLHVFFRRSHLERNRLMGLGEIGVPGIGIVFAAVPPLQGVVDLATSHGAIAIVAEVLTQGHDVGQFRVLAPVRAGTLENVGGDTRCTGPYPGHDRDP